MFLLSFPMFSWALLVVCSNGILSLLGSDRNCVYFEHQDQNGQLGFYQILLELVGAGPETRGGVLKHKNLQQFMGGMTKDHSWSSLP